MHLHQIHSKQNNHKIAEEWRLTNIVDMECWKQVEDKYHHARKKHDWDNMLWGLGNTKDEKSMD